jgi:hypothetical protein
MNLASLNRLAFLITRQIKGLLIILRIGKNYIDTDSHFMRKYPLCCIQIEILRHIW